MAVPQRSRSQRVVAAADSIQRDAGADAAAAATKGTSSRPTVKPAAKPTVKTVAKKRATALPKDPPAPKPAVKKASGQSATKTSKAAGKSDPQAAGAAQAAAARAGASSAGPRAAASSPPKSSDAPSRAANASPFQIPGFDLPGVDLKPVQHALESMGQSLGRTLQSIAGLTVPPDTLQQIQQDYLQQASRLWNQALEQPDQIKPQDRRFAAPEWGSNLPSAFMASMYLLNARTLQRLADNLQGDEKARQRVRFAVQQWSDAAAPSNFLAFNPEVIKKAVDTQGESLSLGIQHLMHDIRQGHMSQTDESVFEVGRNVATTAGSVVFENAYFQLIEYAPLTSEVHEVPFLFVPPCINKYYILDLQPDNSLVRYLLSQGHRVFMVSWVNADESLAQATWDDYVQQGVMQAIDVTREVAGVPQINALGFCVGGTLIATALATLAERGEKPVKSLTLLTAFLDFKDTGVMDVFVDEAMVSMREMTIGPDSPNKGGLMKGGDLAATFSFLRANDLVWNYVVGNYLKGETPPAFDLLYWNSDSTNLPGPFYTWYLRNTYLEN